MHSGDSAGAARAGFWRDVGSQLRAALPPFRQSLVGALLWAAAMAASAALGLSMRGWETPASFGAVVSLFAAGGAVAFPIALFLARLLGLRRRREAAFAGAFLSFSIVTIGVTAFSFALIYRLYYARWHEEMFTIIWAFQLFFTVAAALAQFAVLGIRLFFPLGFAALFAVSLWFCAKAR
ncbi:MAG TPA: hypothetical protein VMF90_20915 [Rhizobiaceae bacterium]|nr:hypothetical protein [Rhizobiaceae bacterium]